MVQAPDRSIPSHLPADDTVKSVSWHAHLKHLHFVDHPIPLVVPRSACVSKGDHVRFLDSRAFVVCRNGLATISPTYVATDHLHVGNLALDFVFKEITSNSEWAAYESLTDYHYRSHMHHGRTAKLVILSFAPFYPRVVGYVELATPFYMNKPRSRVLDAPFCSEAVSWQRWNMPTIRQFIHVIVRIARCVIYPEFRGMGLGKLLVRHAAAFARERWQVAGLKPCFLEISADMLKFVPFAETAGMEFIGETEGNLNRVAKDMLYLIKNKSRVRSGEIVKEDSCGIVDQQVARMEHAARLMKEQNWSQQELQGRLSRLSSAKVLRDYDLFHNIVSLPKPTYLMGLTPEAKVFLDKRLAEFDIPARRTKHRREFQPIKSAVTMKSISISFHSQVRRTQQTHAIQQAFGISPDSFSHTVISDLSVQIAPGDIILVTGSSGSGKSTLLRLLENKDHPGLTGKIEWPEAYCPASFTSVRSSRALIELLDVVDVATALDLLGVVGLSDAFVYLKRFRELSNGQQYRAMLARLISNGRNVWLADEFCANLDPLTANIVADRLQRVTREIGAVLVVASSQPAAFVAALRPDKVLLLTTSWEHREISGEDFLRECSTRSSFSPRVLPLSPESLRLIRTGMKKTTIHRGRHQIPKGFLLFQSGDQIEPVEVIRTTVRQVRNLTQLDAVDAGFNTLAEMRSSLQSDCAVNNKSSWVTLVDFHHPCRGPQSTTEEKGNVVEDG